MFEYILGELTVKKIDYVVLDISGLGYKIYISLKNDPFSEEELQNYTVITLPEIKDKSKYKKLENLIKSLIKQP